MANADGRGSTPKRLCRLEAPAVQMDADEEQGRQGEMFIINFYFLSSLPNLSPLVPTLLTQNSKLKTQNYLVVPLVLLV